MPDLAGPPRDRFHSPASLVLAETRMQLRLLRRNPVSMLFTVALPLLLLPLLDALQGGFMVELPAASTDVAGGPNPLVDGRFPWMQYATPAIAAFAVAAACFANLAIRTAVARESGVLKRVRGTPLPPAVHLAGRMLSNAVVALVVTVVTLAAGAAFYDVEVAPADVGAIAGLVVLGAATFSALGLAATTIIPNSDAAPAVVYALLFPLAFVSNVFYPPEVAPEWMERTAQALPLGPLVSAMVGAVTPTASGSGVLVGEVAALLGWGVFGTVVALVAFRWAPNREHTPAAVPRRRIALRRLAIPLGVAAAAVGVVVPDTRPAEALTVATVDQLALEGIVTTEILVAPDDIEFGAVDTAGLVGIGGTLPFQVAVLDRGDGPEALGFQGCSIELVSDVEPGWLGAVAPTRRGGTFVQPCNGAVYEADLTCASGPCFGPLVLPVSVDGADIRVRAEGVLTPGPAPESPVPPPPPDGARYRGRLVFGDDDPGPESAFTLASDPGGVSFTDETTGTEIRFVTTSPWLGTISGLDVLGPPDGSELVASVFLDRPLGFASVPTGAEQALQAFATRFTVSQAVAGQRVLTTGPADDADSTVPRGFVRLGTTGPLLAWDTVDVDVQLEGSPRVRLTLTRAEPPAS